MLIKYSYINYKKESGFKIVINHLNTWFNYKVGSGCYTSPTSLDTYWSAPASKTPIIDLIMTSIAEGDMFSASSPPFGHL